MPPYYLITIVILTFAGLPLRAQSIQGKVLDANGDGAAYAKVQWSGSTVGVLAGEEGNFEISAKDITDRRLIFSWEGHYRDTVDVPGEGFIEVKLRPWTVEDVKIHSKKDGTFIDSKGAEVITERELEKGACCDLAGCFNTQTTVRPVTTNFITNSKELRILGLSGVYNQILVDGFPMMIQGQTYSYGISTIPGAQVNKIFVAKGANSVLQGFESIAGQINVIPKSPEKTDRLFVNLYANSFLETQYNAHVAHRWNKWSTLLAAHSTQPARTQDRDGDRFLDLPKVTRYSVFNKWMYSDEDSMGLSARFSGRFVHEERVGGQVDFNPERDAGSLNSYGQTVAFDQPELYARLGFRFNENHNLAVFASGYHQNQGSWYGVTRYDARQTNAYANVQHELKWLDQHLLKAGFSYRHVDRTEQISFVDQAVPRTFDGTYIRRERIPGVFAENTLYLLNDQMTAITGLRLDHLNNYGWLFTPRALVKYDFDEQTSVRVSAGTGWRTANIFTDYLNLLASSRDVVFTQNLRPEQATNFGFSITHRQVRDNFDFQITLDAYRTQFRNQIFPDYHTDPTKAFIANFTGPSISNGLQGEVKMVLFERLELKGGYNYLDVYRRIGEDKMVLPFNPTHRVIASANYSPLNGKWGADLNLHWYGKQRLAATAEHQHHGQGTDHEAYSDPYSVVSGQISKFWPNFDIYAGCENIFDFRQLRPIVGWRDPFGPEFDTSNVWGPTRGREIYLGIRFRIQ